MPRQKVVGPLVLTLVDGAAVTFTVTGADAAVQPPEFVTVTL